MTLPNEAAIRRQFASDNWSGICPEAMAAIEAANTGHVHAYGEDPYTDRACELLRDFFETDCEVFFMFNGTAANSVALAHLCNSYNSVICHELAHVETDEAGAPEFFSNGMKVLLASGELGKIAPATVEHQVERRSDIHYPKPRVLSISQSTEVGTVYDELEVGTLSEVCRRHGLRLHMDGARFANALATLEVPPKRITWEAGVDVLCFGGTKNGMPVGEAVVFFDRALAEDFDYRCKQAGQLASKMRFLSAPWAGMLEGGALLQRAGHANACAQELSRRIALLPGAAVRYPTQSNAVFVDLPAEALERLRAKGWQFYQFIGDGGARFMCSWDTELDDVAALAGDIEACLT